MGAGCERRGQVRERDGKKGSKSGRMVRAPEGCTAALWMKGVRGRNGGEERDERGGVTVRRASRRRGGEEEGSPGDQWTQPRGALHSLGYYVVNPPLRSNTMPAATYYARRYYTDPPSRARLPHLPDPSLSSSARRSPTAHFPLSHPHAVFAQPRSFSLSLSLTLSLSPPSSAQHEHPWPPALTSIRQWRRGVGCRARENSSLHAYTHRRGSLPRPARPPELGYAGDGCRVHIPRWWTNARASSPVWR